MTTRDQEEQDRRIEQMETQIDKNRVDIERLRQEMKWEPWKAMTLAAGAGAALMGALVAVLTAVLTLVLQHHA